MKAAGHDTLLCRCWEARIAPQSHDILGGARRCALGPAAKHVKECIGGERPGKAATVKEGSLDTLSVEEMELHHVCGESQEEEREMCTRSL